MNKLKIIKYLFSKKYKYFRNSIIKPISSFFIKKIGIDLLGLLIFISGILVIIKFCNFENKNDIIGVLVLWFTAAVIVQYTKETYFLKDITRKNYDLERAPFVILNFNEHCKQFVLENIGRGIARNVKIRPLVLKELTAIGIGGLTFPPITAIKANNGEAIINPIVTQDMVKNTELAQADLFWKVIGILEPKRDKYIDLKFEVLYEDMSGNNYHTILVTSQFAKGYHVEEYKKLL